MSQRNFTIFFIKLHNVNYEIWVFRIRIFKNDMKLCYRIPWSLYASHYGVPTIITLYINGSFMDNNNEDVGT